MLVGVGWFVLGDREDRPTLGDRSGIAPTSRMLLRGSDRDLARDLDLVADSGAGWVRFDFDWESAEPERGRYDWSLIDRVVDAAHDRDLRILATPAYTPAWARPGSTSNKVPPADPATFSRFVGAAARRYAPRGVHHWEIWNEPNIVQFWKPQPDPEAYARLLIAAAVAVRAADPEAVVISAGLAPAADADDGQYVSPRSFLGRLYGAGAGSSFDAVGMHPYAFPYGVDVVADWNQFQSMPKTYQVMVDNGDAGKRIWATEFGAPTGTDSQAVSEPDQAAMVRKGWLAWSGWSFAGPMFWYAARDVGVDKNDVEQNFGLVRSDFTPKPALAEFEQMMRLEDPVARRR